MAPKTIAKNFLKVKKTPKFTRTVSSVSLLTYQHEVATDLGLNISGMFQSFMDEYLEKHYPAQLEKAKKKHEKLRDI